MIYGKTIKIIKHFVVKYVVLQFTPSKSLLSKRHILLILETPTNTFLVYYLRLLWTNWKLFIIGFINCKVIINICWRCAHWSSSRCLGDRINIDSCLQHWLHGTNLNIIFRDLWCHKETILECVTVQRIFHTESLSQPLCSWAEVIFPLWDQISNLCLPDCWTSIHSVWLWNST